MDISLILIFWLACGVVAMLIYTKKGRSGLVGFLGGFLCGPIGLLLALASSNVLPKCPFCAERINKEAIVCPHCQRDLRKKTE